MNKEDYVNPTIQECLDLVGEEGNLFLNMYPNLVSLPEGLKIIGNVCIMECHKFTTIPSNVTESGKVSVYDCKSFTTMPAGVTECGGCGCMGV